MSKDEICPLHGIAKILESTQENEYGEDGSTIDVKDVIVYHCPICESEEAEEFRVKQEEFFSSPDASSSSKSQEIIDSLITNDEKPIYTIKQSLIDKYSQRIASYLQISQSVSEAMMQFLISTSLSGNVFSNEKGRVLSNIAIIWVSPSGTNKSPTYDLLIDGLEPYFKKLGYTIYNRATAKGLTRSLSQKAKNEERLLTMLALDEASTLTKDTHNAILSDILETYSKAYDGKLVKVTTAERGDEKGASVYAPILLFSSPVFLKYLDESFWLQGLGGRMFFLKYEIVEPKDIEMKSKAEELYKELIPDLEKVQKIHGTIFNSDSWAIYNAYQKTIKIQVSKAETNLEQSLSDDMYATTSRIKICLNVLKLAIIHSASRLNYTSKGILFVERLDMVKAIRDVEKYHRNLVETYEVWKGIKQQKAKYESIEHITTKLIKIGKNILQQPGKRFKLELVKTDAGSYYKAIKDPEGEFFERNLFLSNSNVLAKNFNEVIETMQQSGKVEVVRGRVYEDLTIKETYYVRFIN